MKFLVSLFSILLLLNLGNFAHSQISPSPGPKFYSEFNPVVGGWSEYQMSAKGEKPIKMKIAIVGKEGNAYWYETVTEGGREGKIISKMLVAGNPNDQKNVKRMIFKQGNEPAMEMPVGMMPMAQQGQEGRGKIVDKGTESIKVPAGTFKTQHLQYQDVEGIADVWIHKGVAPYGLVKSKGKDFEMVLLSYGTGAKTLITETPQKFEMPQLPQIRPKRR